MREELLKELSYYELSSSKAVKVKVPIGIVGIGAYLPETTLLNSDFNKISMEENELEAFINKFGMLERRYAKDESIGDLGVKAAKDALKRYNIDPLDIDLVLVTHSCRDMERLNPPIANYIQTKIGANNACSFNIDNGFNGFLPALFTGASYIASGFYETVLVIATEALLVNEDCSHFTSMLIGDGAAAVVLKRFNDGEGILGFHSMSKECEKAAGLRIDRGYSIKTNSFQIGPFMRVEPNSLQVDVPKLEKYLPFTINETLKTLSLNEDKINIFIFGQQYKELNETWAKNLGIPYEKVHDTISKHGAMKTASIPVILNDAILNNKIKKGDLVLLADQGANWSFASTVIRWCI